MKAKDISGQAPGGKRTKLAEILPLKTPFVIQVFPVYACNFKCNYCVFSVNPEKRGFISDKVIMDLMLYKKCVDDMSKFPEKIKVLRFVGIGEPLLHKDIVEMIGYTVKKNVALKVELLTNASLLTSEMSDALIERGLSRLVVSLQGTSKEIYEEVCGIKIDFNKFIDNLKYFYENKQSTEMYLKIVDTALKGEDDKKKYFKLFGDICDTIAVEHTVPIHSGIDYKDILTDDREKMTQFGLPVEELDICSQPFFTMQINPDGKVVPCYSFEYPGIMGDCNNEALNDIWNGKIFTEFRMKMLSGIKNTGEVCKNCNISKYRSFPEDSLNKDADRLKKLYRGDS
ncbi:MAG: radical SAM protein [Candidatus Firestonebacteria bacterium RIFOXYA2_FULL_40_8]|nr:MAG: radical SAM protein [Candidatus Firestonebacteria bacterium RIFOXYA2_FULL_40_8]